MRELGHDAMSPSDSIMPGLGAICSSPTELRVMGLARDDVVEVRPSPPPGLEVTQGFACMKTCWSYEESVQVGLRLEEGGGLMLVIEPVASDSRDEMLLESEVDSRWRLQDREGRYGGETERDALLSRSSAAAALLLVVVSRTSDIGDMCALTFGAAHASAPTPAPALTANWADDIGGRAFSHTRLLSKYTLWAGYRRPALFSAPLMPGLSQTDGVRVCFGVRLVRGRERCGHHQA